MVNEKIKIINKNGKVKIDLCLEFILLKIGDKIKSVNTYAKEYNVGRGTIQKALKDLEEEKYIELNIEGTKGTYLKYIDIDKILELTGYKYINGSMPLPYSLRYEGLATGLYESFKGSKIKLNIHYVRGSKNRIKSLKRGQTDFVVMSKKSALEYIKEEDEFIILEELSNNSYVGGRVYIFNDKKNKEIKDGMKVAIDYTSIDQVFLTHELCKGHKVKYIEMPYTKTIDLLRDKIVDVAIWNGDDIQTKSKGLNIINIEGREEEEDRAVFLTKKSNKVLNSIIKKTCDIKKIENIQKQVLKGEIIPSY